VLCNSTRLPSKQAEKWLPLPDKPVLAVSCDELINLHGECGCRPGSYAFLLLYEGYLEQDQKRQNPVSTV